MKRPFKSTVSPLGTGERAARNNGGIKMAVFSIAWGTTVKYMRGSSIAGLSHAANSRSVVRALYWYEYSADAFTQH